MNGVSLLIALSALGVTSQVEMVGNQPTYTIRIESLLLEELRQGREVATNVTPKDRGARRFKILVTPEKAYQIRAGGDASGRSDSLVEYDFVPVENRELELWVQIAPDRLETLAAGRAIEGELPQDVPEVHRFRVFVGVNELPRQRAGAPSPPYASAVLPGADPNLAPASGEARTQYEQPAPRGWSPAIRSPQLQGSAPLTNGAPPLTGSAPLPANRVATSTGLGSSRFNTTLRNGPDQSTAPPLIDRYNQGTFGSAPPLSSPYLQDGTFGAGNAGGYNPATQFNPATQYNVAAQGQMDRTAAQNSAVASSAQYPWHQQYGSPNGMPVPQAGQNVYTARPDNQIAPPGTAPINGLPPNFAQVQYVPVQQNAGNTASTGGSAAGATTGSTTTTRRDERPAGDEKAGESARAKSSTPLILTTLALFTSLGVNTYLGWLAYSFFWRYRDAVNETVRARAYNAPGRQAA